MITRFKKYENVEYHNLPSGESQEELDNTLIEAIQENKWWLFLDVIKKGANVNYTPSGPRYTPLMYASNRGLVDFVFELIKHGADVYQQIRPGYDWYDWLTKICKPVLPKITKAILRQHPDFFKEREFRKDANKYNL